MVLMGRRLYDEKIGNIVDDDTAYRRLTRDPTTTVEKVAEQIRALHCKGLIPDQLKDQLKPSSKNDNIGDKDKDGMEGSKDEEQHRLCLPYVKGVSENIEKYCRAIPSSKLRLAFKHTDTIRSSCQEQDTPQGRKEWYMKFLAKIVTRST